MITITINKPKHFKTEKYSGFIKFDYNPDIVKIMRELPFRFYDTTTCEWEIPASLVDDAIMVFKKNNLSGSLVNATKLNEIKEVGLPDTFEYKTNPFEHQRLGVLKGINCDSWFLGDEQGLGKTKTVIDIAVARKKMFGYKHCLIVCGVNTLKWNWVNEIHTHSNEDAHILGQRKRKRIDKVYIADTNAKIEDLKNIEELPYFIITNVESFRNKEIAELVNKLCYKQTINMCAADEMHKMKNPTSQQTKGFLKCQPECKIGMTGTPLMNSPLDLYIILRWLGYESHPFTKFKAHYCVMGGFGGYEIVGYKNMEELTNQVKTIMLRRLKKDVLDLPEKMYVDEYVEMDGTQQALYNEVSAGIKTSLANGELNIVDPLAALIRLRQVTGYPGIISDKVFESAKLDRMQDIVDEAVANGHKVVIFSNWTQMTDEICKRLLKIYPGGVTCITGQINETNRQTAVRRFQCDDTCKIIVGTIGAMGTGLTLTEGTVVIFLDEPWNKALYEQAVDRCHRIGQKNNITIYNLLTKDTIDERIHNIVYKKGVMSDIIIDGKEVENKQALVEYLIS